MNLFSYKIEHDFGLAPNPFWGYCTLAVCRGSVRGNKRLEVGDWVIGTGSKALEKLAGTSLVHYLIYAMKVEEVLTFQEYWEDDRFDRKKPVVNGTLVQMYGDNFYHKDEDGEWIQEDSAHSKRDGSPNCRHVLKDTKVDAVLTARHFYYFGAKAKEIPEHLWEAVVRGVI